MLNQAELQDKNKGELISLLALKEKELKQREEKLTSQEEKLISQEEKLTSQEEKLTSQKTKISLKEKTIKHLEEYIQLLKQSRFGRSSEKYNDKNPQGHLFDEADLPNNIAEIETTEEDIIVPEHARKKAGRKGLDKDLPREKIIHDLSDEEKKCPCGLELKPIGEDITEQLDIIPAKIRVLQHVCKKYACKACERETIKTAKKPKQPIPKSIASPGLLAYVIDSKFQYHLPLYRQEKMLKAFGASVARNTLSLWVIKCSQLLQPLVNLLQDEIVQYTIAYADESTLQVLKEDNKTAESKSYMWAFGGGPPDRFCYVYQYHPGRHHHIAVDFFGDFKGYLHCDGYQAYDALSRTHEQITQVGCWYHARRKFTDAAKVSKRSGMADWFIKQIGRLSNIEKVVVGLEPDKAKAYRLEKAPDVMQKIKLKLNELKDKTPKEGLLGKAIHYTLNQWPKLQVYLEDGRLEISNNRMERAIKPFAIGRKNWLFSGSVEGANAAANLFSLVETCKAHEVNVYDWLRATLTQIPTCETVEQLEALLPFNFKKEKN